MKRFSFLMFILSVAFMITAWFRPAFANDISAWPEPGLHLLAGGGLGSSVYSSDENHVDGGVGVNFGTDVSYFLNDKWAVDWSSNVSFNHVNKYLIWNTQLTLGVRYRFDTEYFPGRVTYARVFAGRAPTVLFLNGDTPKEYEGMSRVQFEGPVAGVAWGLMKKAKSGRDYYFEIAGTVQHLEQQDGIEMEGEVPVVIMSGPTGDHSQIYSIRFTLGLLVF
jgi:hypothetical protein